MEGAIVAVTRKTRTAIFKHLVGLVLFGVLLGVAFTTEAAPSSNVAYRRIDVQDAATGELFPTALWYPTPAAPISGVGVWVGRPKQVSRVIDALLGDSELGSHIQRERIGVVGHSNGGDTALGRPPARS